MWGQPLKQGTPVGATVPPSPRSPGCPLRLEEGAVDRTLWATLLKLLPPATWTQINQESRTEHTLGSVTMTISYRFIPGELRSYIKFMRAQSPPT